MSEDKCAIKRCRNGSSVYMIDSKEGRRYPLCEDHERLFFSKTGGMSWPARIKWLQGKSAASERDAL